MTVTFDIANFAKELGFMGETNDYYVKSNKTLIEGQTNNMNVANWSVAAPDMLTLKEWIEEFSEQKIVPIYEPTTDDYYCVIYDKENSGWVRYVVSDSKASKTYNEALMIGLMQGLKLMEEKQDERTKKDS